VANSRFKVGDVIVDKLTGKIGLLLERYDVFDDYPTPEDPDLENMGPIWAWEIMWSGSKATTTKISRYGAYTELGLTSLIRDEQFELIKKISE
tara:strand:+ start:222 stop:500 length:279 start_codon:yes stop_codon:yes gene_type:complete